MSIKNWFSSLLSKDVIPVLGILGIVVAAAVMNYEPGTWYWGWDNLVPEINPWLSFTRQLAGFWQEYQGVGTIGGHGYMAALPHTLAIALLDLLLPTSMVRYVFTFMMYWAGGLGSYFLIKYILTQLRTHESLVPGISFLGSLYYLLNLGTIFTFYLQLEPFIVMYGIFPWVLLQLYSLLDEWSNRKLALFFLLNIALSVIGFIPPVFITYGLFLVIILLWYIWHPFRREKIKQSVIVGLVVLAANIYWLLPLAYYSVTQTGVYLESKLNQVSTADFIQKNKAYGSITNVPLLKGFFFESLDLQELSTNGETKSIADPWVQHLSNPFILLIGYSSFIVILIGFVSTLLKKTRSQVQSVYPLFLTVLAGLGMSIFPFSLVSTFMSWIPFLNQAFRSPYNKLSMSASLFYAILFSIGIAWIVQRLQKRMLVSRAVTNTFMVVITTLLIIFSWPSFNGAFLYAGNRVTVPDTYFEMFNYFDQQSTQNRVMTFPLQSYNGWVTHDWGYTGSGFLWYGIEQPLMDRAFDVWNASNETFYNEASRAFYMENPTQFGNVLNKYDVTYILIDESVTAWGNTNTLSYETTKEMMKAIDAEQVWSKDFLSVYEVPVTANSFVTAPSEVVTSTTNSLYASYDPALNGGDNYVVPITNAAEISYPFAGFATTTVSLEQTPTYEQQYQNIPVLDSGAFTLLKIPQPTIGQYYGAASSLEYINGVLTISFLPSIKVVTEKEVLVLPQLPSIEIAIPDQHQTISLFVNNQLVEINNNQKKEVFFQSLQFGKAIIVQVYDKNNVSWNNGSYVVNGSMLAQSGLSESSWNVLKDTFEVDLTDDKLLAIQVASESQEYLPSFKESTLNNNCDVFNRGSAEKIISESNVSYVAKGFGTFCEGIYLTGTTTRTPSLIEVAGENTAGKGLKINVLTQNQQFGGFEAVTKGKEFNHVYPLLSWPNQPLSGYTLSVETKSYGNQTTSAEIHSVKLYPLAVDFEYLAKIQLVNENILAVQSNVLIKKVDKWSNFYYRVELKNESDAGVLTLSQSNNPGWIAFKRSALLDHIPKTVYNNWANAWIIPKGEYVLTIIYWPQLLNSIGFIVTVYSLYLLFPSFKKTP